MPLPLPEIAHSRYAVARLQAHPEWAAELADPAPFAREAMAAALVGAVDEADLKRRLRQLRQRVLLRTLARDLSGRADCAEVCATTSDLAEVSIGASLAFLGCEEMAVVGMGKLGGRELNYSSDIDVVVFFDPDTGILKNPDDATETYARLLRRLIRILQDRTGDGYVFRTDLRLRPDPGSTPLAIPIEAAMLYYEGRGQNWERAAFIKARPVGGDVAAGERFLKDLIPFVFRKYLDYAAIADIHSIKR